MHHGQRAICRVSGYTQDSLRPFGARQVPTNVRMRRGRLGKAARRDITSQPIRVWWYVFTSHGFSADSDAATPRQTQTDNDASGNPQRVAGRPPLPFAQVTVLHFTAQKGSGRPLR